MKKFLKSYCVGFIISVLLCGSVYAATYFASSDVTYDNTVSGLSSTDVQGALDELYTECTTTPAGEQIIEEAGLEKDEYECRYFLTGGNPNNYITFNGEKAGWRIISVECDGTIKIMRTESIGDISWDGTNSNNWARPASAYSLNAYLNGTYYNGLNSTSQSQIVAKDWGIGSVTPDNNNMANTISNENRKKWNGKVALVTVSEYLRSNSNKSSCGSFRLNNDNYSSCKNTNWMYYSSEGWWTLSPVSGYSIRVFSVGPNGDIDNYDAENTTPAVRPTLYLSSEVKITGGTGTSSDPYQISL